MAKISYYRREVEGPRWRARVECQGA